MEVGSSDQPEQDQPPWNDEGDDLTFIRDEGLDLLALFRSIKDREKRRLIVDLLRVMAGEKR